jgi:hypothetical protein
MDEHRLELFREIASGAVPDGHVFVDVPPAGNSIPKARTYLLVELVKALGGHTDLGCHTYCSSISKVHSDGSFDYERAVPAPLWASALKPGYLCASHTEYCPRLEQYFLGRKQHKMLFIVRDPRDISWVDFVYHSFGGLPKNAKVERLLGEAGTRSHPDDASQSSSCITTLPQSGIRNFMCWRGSRAV